MSLVYQGSVTLADGVPVAAAATASLTANLTAPMADVTARIAGLATLSVAPPTLVVDLIAQLTAQIGALTVLLGNGVLILPPTVSGSLTAVADLTVTLAAMQAGLDFAADLDATLGVGGIHYYVATDSRAEALGSELAGLLSSGVPGGSGGGEFVNAVVFVANTSGAKAALSAVFG